MTREELFKNILRKKSFLCVGLDTDIEKIPQHLLELDEPIFEFNKAIIDATIEYAVAYKPNLAFYEAEGVEGWIQLEKSVEYIRKKDPSVFIIADAKRGDIGNTAERYAKAFYEKMDFDSVTLAPYMGRDSIDPFLKYEGKWAITLALTSNPSAEDFETKMTEDHNKMLVDTMPLYERVIRTSMEWGTTDNTMFVVGATRAKKLAEIRQYCPDHFFLVPGVGAQGGSLEEVARYGMNSHCGLLVNSSRAIIYLDKSERFAEAASQAAKETQREMAGYLSEKFGD